MTDGADDALIAENVDLLRPSGGGGAQVAWKPLPSLRV
jgi:hypothetical protein